MNASLLAVLNDAERLLIAQTGRAELAALDEDAAIELETRIRRARNKYVGQYRRAASASVAEHGGRGKARPENRRAIMKAEAFEEGPVPGQPPGRHPGPAIGGGAACGTACGSQGREARPRARCAGTFAGSGGEVAEQVIDDEGRPQDGFDDGPHMSPEAVGMLPVIHKGTDEPQTIDRASAAAPRGACGLRRA